jgi:LEA14-like dessication related protein
MIKKLAVLLLITSLLGACNSIEDLELIGSPRIELNGIDSDGLKLGLVVKIRNPNKYSFHVKKGQFNVQINGNDIGNAKLSEKVKIDANSTEIYTFPVSAKLQGEDLSLDLILSTIMRGQFDLKLDGTVKAGSMLFIYDRFDVDWEERVSF